MPCLNIIRGLLAAVISVEELEKKLRRYLHEVYGGQQRQLVSIDGKSVRGTIPAGSCQGVHLDVTLREDATRINQPTLARASAAINNFVTGLSRSLSYANLAAARRMFNAQIAAQLH